MQLLDSCQIAYAFIDRCEPVKTARGRLTGYSKTGNFLVWVRVADNTARTLKNWVFSYRMMGASQV